MECDYMENSIPVKIPKEAAKDEPPETKCKRCNNTSTFPPRPTTMTEPAKRFSTLTKRNAESPKQTVQKTTNKDEEPHQPNFNIADFKIVVTSGDLVSART